MWSWNWLLSLYDVYVEDSCPICLQPMVTVSHTECGHTFCTSCLLRSFQERSTCPCCRAVLVETNEASVSEEEEEEEEEEEVFFFEAPLETIVERMKESGYTYEDVVSFLLQRVPENSSQEVVLQKHMSLFDAVEEWDDEWLAKDRVRRVLDQVPMVAMLIHYG